MTPKTPVGVLISGSGTNLQALLDACARPDFPARIAVVLSNVPTAYGLQRAQDAGVPTVVVPHRPWPSREAYDAAVVEKLRAHGVEWVCLAGFMRIVTPVLLEAFGGRVLNIHPSLLPSFPGLHAQRQALQHGVKLAGATVHLVDAGMDSGPIVAQAAVPVLAADTEDTLKARILEVEHTIYPEALRQAVRGELAPLLAVD
ncbi:MAG: phosphoribosylglycinamide formyltransferase [Alphaproteobacteria bacterium]|nr:phosphoribosylglycinamide formyltransferase [Alphaproteobacteria bacterium]